MSIEVVQKVRNNAWLFLRRAIKELISHDDFNDDGLTEEKAIMATTMIQMSFELSLVAYFVKKKGILGIVQTKDASLSEIDLLEKFENNDLKTKSFESLKTEALSNDFLLNSDDEFFIDQFQRTRNKFVHLHYNYDKGELYDLKYDLTYFLIKVLIPALAEEETDPSQAIAANIDSTDFRNLVKFPPYAYEMYKVARENSETVYRCLHCGNDSLATDYGSEYCYSCCEDFSHAGFIDCPYCKAKRAMVYDTLNIEYQSDKTIKGLCLKCDEDDLVYVCKKCESEVPLEANIGRGKCCPGFCEMYDN